MAKDRRRWRKTPARRPAGAVLVTESAPTAVLDRPTGRTPVVEATTGGATVTAPGRVLIRLIRAGWSLNGNYYSSDVLRRAAEQRVFPVKTQCFADHATDDEDRERPVGSIRNLAGALVEDARWDEQTLSLVAEARLFHPWREAIVDMADTIGMSIRSFVIGEHGEAEGRQGFVVHSIAEGRSVDFVTVPAAGGQILSVLEAVGHRPTSEARNVGAWLESRLHLALTQLGDEMYGDGRLTREERITLSTAIGDALSAWTARVESDAPQLFERDLWDEPAAPAAVEATEAVTRSDLDPPQPDKPTGPDPAPQNVTGGAPPAAPNQSEEEPAMSGTQTGAPPEQAGTETAPDTTTTTAPPAPAAEAAAQPDTRTVAALEAVTAQLAQMQQQLAAVQARADQRDAENRALRNRHTAAEAVNTVLRQPQYADVVDAIGARVTSRVLAAIPTTADGAVDGQALSEAVDTAAADEAAYVRGQRAAALEEAGLGLPRGLGAARVEEPDGFDAELEDFFSTSLGMTAEAAKIAAKGRV